MDTIFVVSDYPVVLEGLHKVLSRRGYRVVKNLSAEPVLESLASNKDIKLILMDLPVKEDGSNLNLVDSLRERAPGIPFFVLAPREELNLILSVEDAGLNGAALKDEAIQEIAGGIRMVAEGEVYRSPEFEERIKEAKEMRKLISAKDREVLRRLTTGEANRDIAHAMGLSEKTVEYHRSNILKKLGARSMFEATRRALHLGIID